MKQTCLHLHYIEENCVLRFIQQSCSDIGVVDKIFMEMKRNIFDSEAEGENFLTAFYKKVHTYGLYIYMYV